MLALQEPRRHYLQIVLALMRAPAGLRREGWLNTSKTWSEGNPEQGERESTGSSYLQIPPDPGSVHLGGYNSGKGQNTRERRVGVGTFASTLRQVFKPVELHDHRELRTIRRTGR